MSILHEPMCELGGTTRGVCIDVMERYFFCMWEENGYNCVINVYENV